MGLLRLMDKDLVKKAANGDSDAFNILVGRWEQRLFNYTFRLTGDREDALDVCQDTFLKAYQQMARLQDFSKFNGWLFKIARNFCISHYRSKTRSGSRTTRQSDQELETFPSGERRARLGDAKELEPAELRLLVEGALDQISFEQRETVVLKIYEGLRFDEIAEVSGCPLSTVKSRMYLGLSRLKSILMKQEV